MSDHIVSPTMLLANTEEPRAGTIVGSPVSGGHCPIRDPEGCPQCGAVDLDVLHERRKMLARRIRKVGPDLVEQEIRGEWPTRVRHALRDWSFRSILCADLWQLLTVKNLGRKSLNDLDAVLKRHGLEVNLGPGWTDYFGFK